MLGKVPKRKKSIYEMSEVVPGWNDDYDWEGVIETEKYPQLVNPVRGYVASANNWIHDRLDPEI